MAGDLEDRKGLPPDLNNRFGLGEKAPRSPLINPGFGLRSECSPAKTRHYTKTAKARHYTQTCEIKEGEK